METDKASLGLRISIFFGSSFLLNLIWENLQAPFYRGYISFPQHFQLCLKAAAGDLLFMVVIYAVLAFIHRDLIWIKADACRRPFAWLFMPVLGFVLAIGYEAWAIGIAHRWEYAASMPLLPYINIGWLPVLQMVGLPIVSLFISCRLVSPR